MKVLPDESKTEYLRTRCLCGLQIVNIYFDFKNLNKYLKATRKHYKRRIKRDLWELKRDSNKAPLERGTSDGSQVNLPKTVYMKYLSLLLGFIKIVS